MKQFFYIIIAFLICLICKNSFELMQNFNSKNFKFNITIKFFNKNIYLKFGGIFIKFAASVILFLISIWMLIKTLFANNTYSPFIYFNF